MNRREEKRREKKRREQQSVRSDLKYLIVCTADLEACNQYDCKKEEKIRRLPGLIAALSDAKYVPPPS